jgi:hypothetical protein
MTDEELNKTRRKIGEGLARAALWKTHDMLRKIRKATVKKQARARAERLCKEFRQLKTLLLAQQDSDLFQEPTVRQGRGGKLAHSIAGSGRCRSKRRAGSSRRSARQRLATGRAP